MSNGTAEAESGPLTRLLERLVDIKPDEVRATLWAAAYFFFLFASYYILRPIRDQAGLAGGVRNLPWLFTGTMIAMLLVNPPFAALVAKLPRQKFVPLAYRFFILNLVVFYLLFTTQGEASQVWIGRAFYIWTAVYNLFVVSIFWGFMADAFKSAQGKRLFGFIGAGGTLGTIVGSTLTATLVTTVGAPALLLVSGALLEVAVQCALALGRHLTIRHKGAAGPDRGTTAIGGGVMAGITHVIRSPYLLGICGYMFLYTIGSTFLYFQQATLVDQALSDRAAQTQLFAKIDLAVNVLTIVIQLFFTGRLLVWLGVAGGLMLVPAISVGGFLGLGFAPSIAMLVAFLVLRRAGNYAVARPSREVLYTVVGREDKFKAKSFIDTFVYRLGDQVGAWADPLLKAMGLGMTGIALVAAPIAGLWLVIGLWLGRRHAAAAARETTPGGEPLAAS
ncbi:MAG: NTP/NDP exchange transporter [Gemmatimonadales bacterium]